MFEEVLLVSEASGQHYNVAVHDAKNGQSLCNFKGGVSQAGTLCVRGEEYILSAVPDKPIIQVFEMNRKSQNPVKMPVPGVVSSLSISHDGMMIAAGIKNDVLVWCTTTGELVGVLSRHYQRITSLKFSNDDSYLVSGGEDGIVSVWDLDDVWDNEKQQVEADCCWTCYTNPVTNISFGVQYRFYSSSLDCSVKVHDIPSRQIIMTFAFDDSVTTFCTDPNETSLFVGCSNGTLACYDLLQCNHQSIVVQASEDRMSLHSKSVKDAHSKKISCISCSMHGNFIVTGSDGQEVKFWDAASLQCVKSIKVNGALTNLLLLPAYQNFMSAPKIPIMMLPKLHRQLKSADDETNEENVQYFNTCPSSS